MLSSQEHRPSILMVAPWMRSDPEEYHATAIFCDTRRAQGLVRQPRDFTQDAPIES